MKTRIKKIIRNNGKTTYIAQRIDFDEYVWPFKTFFSFESFGECFLSLLAILIYPIYSFAVYAINDFKVSEDLTGELDDLNDAKRSIDLFLVRVESLRIKNELKYGRKQENKIKKTKYIKYP